MTDKQKTMVEIEDCPNSSFESISGEGYDTLLRAKRSKNLRVGPVEGEAGDPATQRSPSGIWIPTVVGGLVVVVAGGYLTNWLGLG